MMRRMEDLRSMEASVAYPLAFILLTILLKG